ncbi:hypothetical protein ACFV7R_24385 [Streptomyces sp. NPDC059866]|uniref:hypothetical protein n=1 Tax=Streptomyces sp. NPDC059866 TaxID=3346978 RepID=UPI003652DD9A
MTHTPEAPLEMRQNGLHAVVEPARAGDDQGLVPAQPPFGGTTHLVCRSFQAVNAVPDVEKLSVTW